MLADLRPDEKNRAKELIEDFMIAANGVTARYLAARAAIAAPRAAYPEALGPHRRAGGRVGRAPAADAGRRCARRFSEQTPQADPARFADISLAVVKLLGSGEYALQAPGQPAEGHFGLAVRDYAHSTAPNRRFPDLVTQRLLKAALRRCRRRMPTTSSLALARHCTEQEDNAAKVERQVRKSAAALLLATRIGARFEAIVTGASDKGTWVRISGRRQKAGSCAAPGGSTSAIASAWSLSAPTSRAALSISP